MKHGASETHIPTVSAKIQQAGLKNTPARAEVYSLLQKSHEPLSIIEIQERLKSKKINTVTFYRVLADFEKVALVRRVDIRKDSVCYEIAENHHHHIVCTSCGSMEDIDGCAVDEIVENFAHKSKKFDTILEHSFELFGCCNKCAKTANAK